MTANPSRHPAEERLQSSDVLARLPLRPEQVRGVDEPDPSFGAGTVSCGRPLIFPVPVEDLPVELRRRAQASGRHYYGLLVAFDLNEPPDARRYTSVRFEVALDDAEAVAVRLDRDGGTLGLSYAASSPHPLTPAADRAILAATTRQGWLLRLAPRSGRPRAWSFGLHRHRFGWTYEDPSGAMFLPLTYGMHAMIEVPPSTRLLSGRIGLRVETLGTWRHRPVHRSATLADSVAFREALPENPVPSGAAVRLCLAADVTGYSRRPNHLAERTQSWLVRSLAEARAGAGLDEATVVVQAQGDGQFAVLPVGIDESRVIPDLICGLAEALRRTNDGLSAEERVRLRVALHRGLMKPADSGWVGTAAIAVHRILDSPPLRAAIRDTPTADYVLGVPDLLYQDVIRHSVVPPLPHQFTEITIDLPDKGFVEHGWLHVPVGSR
ncbi:MULTISPECIES: hypothetical protein [Micromonospora]|uniref:hypothetical protein n=1 Tax=Micromonospora TaxID=1873 RepID=UPI000A3EF75A|nr:MULTISPECIES: hypothetical protein [Micromonospora]RUL95216.1 hypothetical protein EG812_06155 [Verrucosispora sp. FIM060022]